MTSRNRIAVVAAAATLLVTALSAQNALPTMGSLVLRMAMSDESVRPLLMAAVGDPDAGVRAVSARIAAVGRHTAMTASLTAALAQERNPDVAAEQVRALLLMATPEAIAAVEAHMTVAAAPAVVAYALRLARVRPAELIDRLPALVDRLGASDAAMLAPAVMTAANQYPDHRAALLRAWLDVAPADAWRASLDSLGGPPELASDVALLVQAARSGDEAIRTTTVWMVLDWIGEKRDVPGPLLAAVASGQPDADGWERVGREMAARRRGARERVDQAATLRDIDRSRHAWRRTLASLDNLLTRPERDAIRRWSPDALPRVSAALPRTSVVVRHAHLPRLRTVSPIWPGFLDSLFEATGCRASGAWRFGLLRLEYDDDGRPRAAARDTLDLSPECATALAAYATVALADEDAPIAAGDSQWLLLPVAQPFLECTDHALAAAVPLAGEPELPEALLVTSRPMPRMPDALKSHGLQAAVAIDAVISRDGCVSSAAVRAGGAMAAELEALRSLLQWRYRPPVLDDVPVTVRARFTFAFTNY